eukprot:sb/3475876/
MVEATPLIEEAMAPPHTAPQVLAGAPAMGSSGAGYTKTTAPSLLAGAPAAGMESRLLTPGSVSSKQLGGIVPAGLLAGAPAPGGSYPARSQSIVTALSASAATRNMEAENLVNSILESINFA